MAMITMADTRPPGGDRRRWVRHGASAAVWCAVASAASWAAARAVGADQVFPATQLMAFTPYVAAASVVPLAVALGTRRWWAALIAASATASLAVGVLPRTVGSGSSPAQRPNALAAQQGDVPPLSGQASEHALRGRPTGPTLRVLSTNLMLGAVESATVVSLVRRERVDLLAIQEYTPGASRGLKAAGLESVLSYRVSYPEPGAGGSALYSRFPLRDDGQRRLPSGFTQARALLTVPGALPVEVESAHPAAPINPTQTRHWAADLANEPPAQPDGPVRILLGDFNATLDHAPLRALLASGYRDAAETMGAGLTPTWPYDERWYIPPVTLDHVLVDARVGVRAFAAHPMAPSDHRAVSAELTLPAT